MPAIVERPITTAGTPAIIWTPEKASRLTAGMLSTTRT
jgi:hypothetical protein